MKNINENVINKMKKIVKDKQAMKIDGVLVDLYTASAVTQIYDKVNPANKKKMEKMSPQSLQTAAFKILGKKESVSEDASGMNPKQKMKFDQLMKKLDGGKEHMKFKRMAKTPVQGDDMFHGYVKDLAMKEQTEIVEYTTVSPKMAKVFDSLKVGDKLAYKTKRYSSDGHKVTKKKMLRHNQLGWEQITLGKGVYLLKKEKTKEVLMKSGNMPVTIIDLVKESMNETVQVNEVQGSDYDFSPIQLSRLKKAYSTVKRIDPTSQNYKKLKKAISKLHPNTLEKIAREKIRFVSVIAAGEYEKKSGKRLHARDYMWFVESTELEESVKISFHSKGAKTKWMKKQGVASKEIINQTPTCIELPSRWKDLSKKKDHDEIFSVINEAPKPFGRVGPPIPKPSQVRSAISRVKKQLMKKYKQKGGYENFGQKELEKMKTQFNYNSSGEPDEREIAKMLRAFDDWAMDYDGDMREGYFNKELESGQYVPGMEKMYVDIIKKNGGKNIKVNKPNRSEPSLSIDFDGGNTTKMEKEIESKGDGTETLDESMARARADARRHMSGRGAQRGMAPLKKDVDNSASDADRKAANKNIIMQIKKAADLPNGAEVEFPSGKKKLDRNTAQKLLTKFGSLRRSSEKDTFQKSIRSLDDVKKLIGR